MMTRQQRDAAVSIMKAVAALAGDQNCPYREPDGEYDSRSLSVFLPAPGGRETAYNLSVVRRPTTPLGRLLDWDYGHATCSLAEILPEIAGRCGFDLFGGMALARALRRNDPFAVPYDVTVTATGNAGFGGFAAPGFRDTMRDVFDPETLDCVWSAYYGCDTTEFVTPTPATAAAAAFGAPFYNPRRLRDLILVIAENVVANDGAFVAPPVPAALEVA